MMFMIGIFIHLIFLYSIFDIYFKSPIVKDVQPFEPIHEAPADRVVLVVLDGLRAESFLNHTAMPYMRSVANSKGRWGISNTRVPTESRPGHVAIIAGFYEDPSSVTKGWTEFPVDFDSVFNRTTNTWSWGCKDILEIFTKRGETEHIFTDAFDNTHDEAFTNRNTSLINAQVLDKATEFFNQSHKNETFRKKLLQKKIVFFLHLIGTDDAGHKFKPKTEKFFATIRFVDEKVKELEATIRNFYNDDGRTAFLMTSDHGMTDWGSHGAGSDHETQTPYVLWGAGVQQVKQTSIDLSTNGMSLDHRLDIDQADLAPLMATLLSIPVPVNSLGRVPINLLNMSLADKAKAVYGNSRQLASQYNKKRSDVESYAIRALHYPYKPFTEEKYKEMIKFTEKLLDEQDYKKLIAFSEEIMSLSLSGLNYYHNYYQIPLLVLVSLSFLGWIANLLKLLCHQSIYNQTFRPDSESSSAWSKTYTQDNKTYNKTTNLVFLILSFIGVLLVYAQNLPMTYYVYFVLPMLLWRRVLVEPQVWIHTCQKLSGKARIGTAVRVFLYTVGCFALGLSLRHRWALSVPLVGMAVWPFFSKMPARLPTLAFLAWSNGCILLSVFSFIPVVGKDTFIELVVAAGIIWILISVAYIYFILLPLYHKNEESFREVLVACGEMLLLALALQNVYFQSKRDESGAQVSRIYQAEAWIIAVLSLTCPVLHSARLVCRLHGVYSALLRVYLLLSVAHEGLFTLTLIANSACWLYIEMKLLSPSIKITDYLFVNDRIGETAHVISNFERSINGNDFRRAFFFISYIILSFFGTGNIASINSFEVRWVMCFITSFSPFIITALILLKTLMPFLIVACSFRGVQLMTKAPAGYLNIIVLIYSNIMGLQQLFDVKNEGSWLEIGTSISHYVIVQLITLFIVLINQIAKLMTDLYVSSFASKIFKSRKKHL